MIVNITIHESDLKQLVKEHLENKFGGKIDFEKHKIEIQVKSKQNYKSEWEEASFKAIFIGDF